MTKIIGGYKEHEHAPLKVVVEYKDAFWTFYKDEGSEIVYGDFIPVASLEELEFVPNVEIDEFTKEKILSALLRNKASVERNIRSYLLNETFDPITQEWIKPEN